jgi:hypothetical protein
METTLRVRAADLSWQQVDDELVILDLTTSRYLSLNGTAARLWGRLVDGAGVDELTAYVGDEFGVPDDEARADVVAFLEQCRELGLVE